MGRLSQHLGRTFLGQTIARSNLRTASSVGAFVMAWTAVHADLGHRPTVDDYAEFWGMSLATAYREQATFREVWPEFLTPSDVALALGLNPVDPKLPSFAGWADPLAVA